MFKFEALYRTYLEPLVPHLLPIGIALAVLLVTTWVCLPIPIRAFQRWRNWHGQRRILSPKTWFARQAKVLFDRETALLANEEFREMMVPASKHIVDLTEEQKEKGVKRKASAAWLSPYRRAVKKTIKDNSSGYRGRHFRARKQIADLAALVTVSPLEERFGGGTDPSVMKEHFKVTVQLNGRAREKVVAAGGNLKSQLGLEELNFVPGQHSGYCISWAAHRTPPNDPLVAQKHGAAFFKEHPAKSPYMLPMAVAEDGRVWGLPTHHTLVVGVTGAGKGSPINAAIFQLTPFVEEGTVRLFGIDPKMSELAPYAESSLFEEVVYSDEAAGKMLRDVVGLMDTRKRTKTMDLEAGDLGRSLKPTRKHPMVVVFVDEFTSLLTGFAEARDRGALAALTRIMTQGRSLNVFIFAAAQNASKESLGNTRDQFGNIILLKQGSEWINAHYLGEGAAKEGFDSVAIPASNPDNNYRYSGIGFVADANGPLRVRFAYSSDSDIASLVLAHPAAGSARSNRASVTPDDPQGDEQPQHLASPGGGGGARALRAQVAHYLAHDPGPEDLDALPSLDEYLN